jgi:5'-3' exonuclease
MDMFEKKLMVDFCSVIKQVNPIINDIVFVIDSHSWRKDLLLQQEYKGNRKKVQDDIDKNGFLTVTGNFTNTLRAMGIKVSQAERSEGDDLIYAWSEHLFNDGKSSLILSTDRDLNQLVKCVNGVHIIQYGPVNNKLWVSEGSDKIIKKLNERQEVTQENLFNELFVVSIENDPFERFVESTNVEVVDPEKVRFMKIVGGDTSDNIFPVYYRPATETSRAKGLGEKTVEKIFNKFKETLGCEFDYHIYGQEDTVKLLCNVIYDVAKINDDEFTRRMLFENIKTNTSLVSLTSESIPDDVIQNMTLDIDIEDAKNPAIPSKITKELIFSKSRFKDYKTGIQMRSNILKGVKDDGDMNFIKG